MDFTEFKTIKATWKDSSGTYHTKWKIKTCLNNTGYTNSDISSCSTSYDVLTISFKDGKELQFEGHNPNAHKRSYKLSFLKS